MLGQDLLEGSESVGGNIEGAHLDIVKEEVELRRVEDDLGEGLVAQALAQDETAVESHFRVLVALEQCNQQLFAGAQVFDGRKARANLPPQEVVEDLCDIFFGFELELVYVEHQKLKQIIVVHFLGELCDLVGTGIIIYVMYLD